MSGQGLNLNTISPVFRDRILRGLIGRNMSVFEEVFGVINTRQVEGAVPLVPSKYMLGNSQENTSIALDGVPEESDWELGEMPFKIRSKFAKRGKVHKIAVEAMEENSAEDITNLVLERAVISVATAIDLEGKTYLNSTTKNGETINLSESATAVWSDASNARPLADLDAIFDAVGNPDTLWLGMDRARELAALPAFRGSYDNFDATGGRLPMPELAGKLMGRYQFLRNIVIDSNWYNDANPQQARDAVRIFDGVVWAGNSTQTKCVEQINLRKSRVFLHEDTDLYIGEAVRYLTFGRGENTTGCILTGT